MDDGGSGVVILAFQGEGTLKSSNGVNSTAFLKVKVKVTQLCPTLCNPMDCTIHGTLQAKILELVAFPFSRASS